jgi:hypothetical protein
MRIATALLVGVLALLTGCASIVSGQNQSLSLVANDSSGGGIVGARCSLVNDKGQWFATTPGSVTVRRSYSDLSISCQHTASAGIAQVKSATKGMAFGNILFGGVIGAGVDVATGAAYDYPDVIAVQMTGMNGSPPSSEPLAAVTTPAAPVPTATATAAVMPTKTTAEPALAPPPVIAPTAALLKTSAILPAEVPAAVAPKTSAKAVVGQDSWTVERLPEVKSCNVAPRAVLSGKGPGFETYNVACGSGDVLAVRCEFGNCRVLR